MMRKPSKRKFNGDFKGKDKSSDSFDRKDQRAPRADREDRLNKESKAAEPEEVRPSASTEGVDPESAISIRLNKYIADAGICSRRKADTLIGDGLVEVDGKITKELGTRINPSSVVRVEGKIIKRQKLVYILLNKPKDYLTTTDDPENRRTVMDLIAKATTERVFPVGRLDRQTTGLLLFTNDGELAQKLMHPSHGVRKIYHVELDKEVERNHLEQIARGLELEDGIAYVDAVAFVGPNKKEVGIEIHIGRNRIVRRIFEHLGYDVRKLDRVMYAGLTKKDLPRKRWRMLSPKEVIFLKHLGGKPKK